MKFATKLILSITLVALIFVPLIGFIVYSSVRNILQANIELTQLELARSTMKGIDRTLYRANQDIQAIADDYLLEAFFEREGNIRKITRKFRREFKEKVFLTGPWDMLMLVDKDGAVLESTWHKKKGKQISKFSVSRIAYYSALKGAAHSDLVTSDITGRPTVIFSAPIKSERDEKVRGVVIGHFTWAVIMQILDRINVNYQADLFNREGITIATRTEQKDQILKHSLAKLPLIKMALDGEIEGKDILTKEGGEPVFAAKWGFWHIRAGIGVFCWKSH